VRLLLICVGGAAGTAARYGINLLAASWLGSDFPFATFIVNVLGSFLIGVVQQLALDSAVLSETARLALTVGVLGGFTTYSSFSYETLRLAQTGAWTLAALNVIATTTLCLVACTLGLELTRLLLTPRP
jgi:fluoride exporter